MTSIRPTGHYTQKADGLYLQFDRLFRAPIEEVWFSLTNPTALNGWIGTYTGSPSTGAVRFRMGAEGDDAPWEDVSILECAPPHRVHLDIQQPDDAPTWRLLVHLNEGSGLTTLTLAHRLPPGEEVGSLGAGWDYYLDRLTAFRAGAALPDWDRDGYLDTLGPHYRELRTPAA